jgi:hypothetical protein
MPDSATRHVASPRPDSEALIVIEFDMIAANSPSNTNSEGPLNTANLQFNNLDIIGNMYKDLFKSKNYSYLLLQMDAYFALHL